MPKAKSAASGRRRERQEQRRELKRAGGLMFNTGIGQHILKNPLVVNSIIDKFKLMSKPHSKFVPVKNMLLYS
ncbi:Dimt1 [Phodopus roborovskii]|uniref:Dimt1 protein n=1 Tax=Phodopus roborovskii TaxID=109678 RepID=A0AAU9Z4L8_PHORO|nr:Dimt1 [Phodopus roborovskii]